MTRFRSPIYLDTETLVPLANYHDIEVMVDVAVTQRDVGRSGLAGAAKGRLPIPGSPSAEVSGNKGREREFTESRTVKDHPTSALNRLLDSLEAANDLVTSPDQTVSRGSIVAFDAEWSVSPATDVGGLFASMLKLITSDPSLSNSDEVPDEVVARLTGENQAGSIVLAGEVGDAETGVVVLLESGLLLPQVKVDDLESERTVFGQVDRLVPEGRTYSLENLFLAGFSRAIRRAFDIEELLKSLGSGFGRHLTADDCRFLDLSW